jgi:hypothetical protein
MKLLITVVAIALFLGICLLSAMLLIKFLSEIINDADKLDNQEQ